MPKHSARTRHGPPSTQSSLPKASSFTSSSSSPPSLDLECPAVQWATTVEETGGQVAQGLAPLVVALFSLLLRWTTGLWPYSGAGIPPMYGDYEAQRHWMELTWHLPMTQWYRYDLQYWGLDYPPLTAYVSWVCGAVGNWINPAWVALDVSRGYEDGPSKTFMRATVLVTDILIYLPAAYGFARRYWAYTLHEGGVRAGSKPGTSRTFSPLSTAALLLFLTQPALTIIDHGHFQYNSVMLGLVLHAYNAFWDRAYGRGAVLFTLALGFKQMALYYALPIFTFLLGRCYRQRSLNQGLRLLVRLGLSVTLTIVALLLPFLRSIRDVQQVFIRIFPVGRGLYEDKVANLWCALGPVLRLREKLSQPQLVRLSAIFTLVACLPVCIGLLIKPSPRKLIYGLASSSLAFFLLSYQVHEKTILLPILPISMLLVNEPVLVPWFINTATFSMLPLLKRDGVIVPLLTGWALWNWLGGYFTTVIRAPHPVRWTVLGSYLVMGVALIVDLFIPPPGRLPDLWTMANVAISAAIFSLSWAYLTARGLGYFAGPFPLEEPGMEVDEERKDQ
ncbi:glycosyl transferase [Piptocephalis cylindrospora]|uniref:Alpha-1,3-glucosyltransferase n=1 Tax=Piptocephalis cylindrospora TaxID=1907219 RepID=A0A4P9Y0K8_9FUNG|nr:glycosyl transferase [Piptocephalis cylindrospora]|eukprot:RKP11561.1 glycosyl transferase [Piptocephalis cylindrospora]